jgi:hypothetical protein
MTEPKTRLSLRLWWQIQVEHRLQYFRVRTDVPVFTQFNLGERLTAPIRAFGRFLYRTRRYIEGARRVDTTNYEGTAGSVCDVDLGLDIEFSGACPIQGEGTLRGYNVYYRSRGAGWQFSVAIAPGGEDGDALRHDAWEYAEDPYFWPEGGWVAAHVSERCIRKAALLWLEHHPGVRNE